MFEFIFKSNLELRDGKKDFGDEGVDYLSADDNTPGTMATSEFLGRMSEEELNKMYKKLNLKPGDRVSATLTLRLEKK